MQDKISSNVPPTPPSALGKTPEASQQLFSKVMDYLDVLAQVEKLTYILHIARQFHHEQIEQNLSAGTLLSPQKGKEEDAMWEKVLNEYKGSNQANPILKQFLSAVEQKDFVKAGKLLQELAPFLISAQIPLPKEQKQELIALFKKFAQKENEEEFFAAILKGQGYFSLASSKMQGKSPAEMRKALEEILEFLEAETPPGPLAKSARKLLETLNGPRGDKIFEEMLQKGTAENETIRNQFLPKLLRTAFENPQVMTQLITASKVFDLGVQPSTLYKSFRKELGGKAASGKAREAMKGATQSEINGFLKLIEFLEKYDPNDPQLQQILANLEKVAKDFPNLTQADLNLLSKSLNQLVHLEAGLVRSGKMPKSAEIQFLKLMEKVLVQIGKECVKAKQELQALMAQLQAQLKTMEGVTGALADLQEVLEAIAKGGMTPALAERLTADLSVLMLDFNKLSPAQKQQLTQLFNLLGKLNPTIAGSESQTLGDAITELWMELYSQANQPNPTISGLKKWIEEQIAAIEKQGGNTGFLEQILKEIKSNVNTPGFPAIDNGWGEKFGTVSGNTFSPNYADYFNRMYKTFDCTTDSINEVLEGFGSYLAYFETEYQKLLDEEQGLQNTYDGLNKLIAYIKAAIQDLDIKIMAAQSLPDAFSDAILNKFMPQQEQYLNAVAALLYYFNYGASMDNTLLNDLMGWGDAGNNYNFSNWYNSIGQGSRSQASTQAQINQEEAQTQGDIDKGQKALADIEAKLKDIQQQLQDGKLTKAQAAKLTQQLTKEKGAIQAALGNLNKLLSDLKATVVNSDGTISNAAQIQADENLVKNGDPNKGGYGGLTSIFTDITNDQTGWSGQSTTQQLKLQETMTIIQQEWTIVSTAMQLLNQMYMAPAQAIYK